MNFKLSESDEDLEHFIIFLLQKNENSVTQQDFRFVDQPCTYKSGLNAEVKILFQICQEESGKAFDFKACQKALFQNT